MVKLKIISKPQTLRQFYFDEIQLSQINPPMHNATYIRAKVRADRGKVKVGRGKVRVGGVHVRVRISVLASEMKMSQIPKK